jgi:hypothetical protein
MSNRKADKRAVRIVELEEELDEAKRIISTLIEPPDPEDRPTHETVKFRQYAARFAGCKIPQTDSGK